MGSSNEMCSVKKEKKRRTRSRKERKRREKERERERERALRSSLCGSVGALVATVMCGGSGPLSLA
jgi:hypothetical protein